MIHLQQGLSFVLFVSLQEHGEHGGVEQGGDEGNRRCIDHLSFLFEKLFQVALGTFGDSKNDFPIAAEDLVEELEEGHENIGIKGTPGHATGVNHRDFAGC